MKVVCRVEGPGLNLREDKNGKGVGSLRQLSEFPGGPVVRALCFHC